MTWIEQHAASQEAAGKPVILEEFGVPEGVENKTVTYAVSFYGRGVGETERGGMIAVEQAWLAAASNVSLEEAFSLAFCTIAP